MMQFRGFNRLVSPHLITRSQTSIVQEDREILIFGVTPLRVFDDSCLKLNYATQRHPVFHRWPVYENKNLSASDAGCYNILKESFVITRFWFLLLPSEKVSSFTGRKGREISHPPEVFILRLERNPSTMRVFLIFVAVLVLLATTEYYVAADAVDQTSRLGPEERRTLLDDDIFEEDRNRINSRQRNCARDYEDCRHKSCCNQCTRCACKWAGRDCRCNERNELALFLGLCKNKR